MTALYEIAGEYQEVLRQFNEIDEDDEQRESEEFQQLATRLGSLADAADSKALACGAYFLNLKSDIEQLKEAAKRIKQRISVLENRHDWFREYLMDNMERLEISKISCPDFEISFSAKQTKTNCSLDIIDDMLVPRRYWKSDPYIDNAMLKQDLLNGLPVPGAQLKYSKSLKIK